jgi:acyl carrier protein
MEIMHKEAFLEKLAELLEMAPRSLTGAEQLSDLESWDSLAVMSFIALADEHFGVAVAPRQIAACKTVNDLAALAGAAVSA